MEKDMTLTKGPESMPALCQLWKSSTPQPPTTIRQALEGLQISTHKKHGTATLAITKLVAEIDMMFNAKFTEMQVSTLVTKIIQTYWHLRVEEVQYVFNMAVQGVYGPAYQGLKIADVLTWLHKYDTEERLQYVMAENGHGDKGDIFRQIDKKESDKLNGMIKQQVMRITANKIAKSRTDDNGNQNI